MAETKIQWADAVWNPIAGCSVVSPGCTNCYAMAMAARIEWMGTAPHYAGLTRQTKAGAVWTGKVAVAPDATLTAPLKWRKPKRIFVNSMSDLFHEAVPDAVIDQIFRTMSTASHHTFLVLTKRADRMRAYLSDATLHGRIRFEARPPWPLPNVWLGVSVEDQARADERIPHLLNTPAAVRWISAEPLLGPIDLTRICLVPKKEGSARAGVHIDAVSGRYVESGRPYIGEWDIDGPYPEGRPARRLDWVVAGGESGRGARPLHLSWIRGLREQCTAAGVPIFIKQLGKTCVMDRTDAATPVALGAGWDALSPCSELGTVRFRDSHGGDPVEWPKDMRVREFPNMGVR